RQARFKQQASFEQINFNQPRGIDKNMLLRLQQGDWIKKSRDLDIPVMLTPHSGHTDPPKDFGQKDKLMTILQFFS
ncbi:hypothetical protein LB467_18965, partial [Salegentibacter sp. JZCK2]|nr:hypothetical protein [Salegentibacter tibetensis]